MNFPKFLFGLLLGKRLPKFDGVIQVQGIESNIEIKRDEWSIPYIKAGTIRDAWFGLGFCQGQDRSFQLELIQRLARGTLSEIFGLKTVSVDKLSRQIGFHRSSTSQFQELDSNTRTYLEAFSNGVNQGREKGSHKKPHEFSLLKFEPSTFYPEDSLSTLKLFGFQMGSNWDSELARLQILLNDGEKSLIDLDPEYPRWHPLSINLNGKSQKTINDFERLSEDIETLLSFIGTSGGSNNWAVSGQRTDTGRPILCNDPHLSPTQPCQWYLARVETPKWKLAGATIIGLPGFAAGHNEHASWGVTAGLADNTDLYIERTNEAEAYQGRTVTHTETIFIKGKNPIVEEVIVTERGPIIGPSIGFDEMAISIRATWLQSTPFHTLTDLPSVRTFSDFKRAWRRWPFSTFNMAYADVQGNIGWKLVGDVPVRTSESGIIPSPAQNNWLPDPIKIEDLPEIFNPNNGFIATANNKPIESAADSIYLGHDWMDGYRIQRIVEILDSKNEWDITQLSLLQMDRKTLPWFEIKDFLIKIKFNDPDAILAFDLLKNWNGNLCPNSAETSIYELFLSNFTKAIAKNKAPKSFDYAMGRGFHPLYPMTFFAARRVSHLVNLIQTKPTDWLKSSTWELEAEKALSSAIKTLKKKRGYKIADWKWGELRPLTISHPLGSQKPLGKIFNIGPIPWGGDANTINQAASPPLNPLSNITTIASLRISIDVGDWKNSRFVLPSGQSGNPVSPHYNDMLPMWSEGKGVPIHWDDDALKGHIKHHLYLKPQS